MQQIHLKKEWSKSKQVPVRQAQKTLNLKTTQSFSQDTSCLLKPYLVNSTSPVCNAGRKKEDNPEDCNDLVPQENRTQ